jgi:hypothetical protein
MQLDFLIKHAKPIDQGAAAARSAAVREAAAQLGKLEQLDLSHAEAHLLVIVRRWCRELRRLLARERGECQLERYRRGGPRRQIAPCCVACPSLLCRPSPKPSG